MAGPIPAKYEVILPLIEDEATKAANLQIGYDFADSKNSEV